MVGMRVARSSSSMTAKDFTELIAWQRADALEQFALEMVKRPARC